jgi:protein disulfide-isomerase A6
MNPKLVSLLLLLILGVAVAHSEEDVYNGPSEEDVIVLDKDNLEDTIFSSEDTWMLELYAPWCGHCKSLRPEWAKLATNLKGIAKVAKIDASVNRQFDQTFGLKGYPTIVMIPGGAKDKSVYIPFDGARKADAMTEWVKEKIKTNRGFLVERLTSEQKWKENCLDLYNPLCIVVFLPHILDSSPEERSIYLEMVKSTVNNFRDKPVSFMWAQAGDHQEFQDIFALNAGFPSVILVNPMRNLFSIMRSSYSEENLEEWLKDILNKKGGKRFGRYHKELVFSTIEETEGEAGENLDIEVEEAEEVPEEL